MRGHGLGKHPAGVWILGGRKDLERLELRGGEQEGWDEAREACGLSVKPDLACPHTGSNRKPAISVFCRGEMR